MMEKSLVEGEFPMKRLFGLIILILVVYVIYFDLSNGTLPMAVETTTSAKNESIKSEEKDINYFERKIQSGDTVLSILENQLDSAIPVPIQQVISDFQSLNNGVNAEKIQIGKTYKFPDYREVPDDSSN